VLEDIGAPGLAVVECGADIALYHALARAAVVNEEPCLERALRVVFTFSTVHL
jgi:hypothetical protein